MPTLPEEDQRSVRIRSETDEQDEVLIELASGEGLDVAAFIERFTDGSAAAAAEGRGPAVASPPSASRASRTAAAIA